MLIYLIPLLPAAAAGMFILARHLLNHPACQPANERGE